MGKEKDVKTYPIGGRSGVSLQKVVGGRKKNERPVRKRTRAGGRGEKVRKQLQSGNTRRTARNRAPVLVSSSSKD